MLPRLDLALDRTVLKPPTPGLFSFNHPLGACPVCKGFGRVIGIDLDKAIPDKSLSIARGSCAPSRAIPTTSARRISSVLRAAARAQPRETLRRDVTEDQRWILEGEGGDPEEAWQQGVWYGVRGFFDWLESRAYRMHVRVFLSRYRSYTLCKACKGTRLKPEALAFKIQGKTLPELWQLSSTTFTNSSRRCPCPALTKHHDAPPRDREPARLPPGGRARLSRSRPTHPHPLRRRDGAGQSHDLPWSESHQHPLRPR